MSTTFGLRPLRLAGGPRGVLLFHGLSSNPQELQFLARGLHRAGYTVSVPLIAGYSFAGAGQALSRQRQWADAALAEFDAMRARCDSVAVGGLCIGAVLALRVAALRGSQVEALLALSTTLHYDGWANPWYRRLLPLAACLPWVGGVGVRERAPYGVKDLRMRGWIAAQMLETGSSDAGAACLKVRDLLEAKRLIADVRRRLPDITSPTLLLHAREDDAAAPRSAFEVALRVSARRVRCVLMTDSFHMLSIDHEKRQVLAELIDFLEPLASLGATVQSAPSGQLIPFNSLSPLEKKS
jgi:carboxylesterase